MKLWPYELLQRQDLVSVIRFGCEKSRSANEINDPQWRPGVAVRKAVSDWRCDPDSFQSKVAQSHGIEHAGLGEGDYMIRDN